MIHGSDKLLYGGKEKIKKVFAVFLIILLISSLCSCDSENNRNEASKANTAGESACAYIEAVFEKDRSALKSYMLPQFYEERVEELLEDMDGGCVVHSTVVVEIEKENADDYEDRIRNFFDISIDSSVEEACRVVVAISYRDAEGEEYDSELEVEMAKIDGKWYGFKLH